ncbi:MAG: S-adenosylmethionine decarboxylase [Candidatus Bathyarchaeota archaeon]
MIGLHMMVDGLVDEPMTRDKVEQILRELPGLIGMSILDGPHVVEGVPENPGWTGFVIIDKSHISVHTFTETSTVSIDVYSCKLFNAKMAVSYLRDHIRFSEVTTRTLTREIVH